VLLALAVTIATALLFHPAGRSSASATPEAYWTIGERCIAKSDFLYLSTITRSSGLLLGAAFAMVWRPGPSCAARCATGPAARPRRLVGLIVLGFLMAWGVHFITADGADPWLFRGGFLVTAIATLLVIAAVTHRGRSPAGARQPAAVVGTRSYGLYLYHWPIYQIIREVAGNALTLPSSCSRW
jgi:peptidoglycan/LPS O-acetylase OafA/YrhL